MQWGDIQQAWWFLALIVLVYLSINVYRWRKKVKASFADSHLQRLIFPGHSPAKFGLKLLLSCLGLFLLILALMEPLGGVEEREVSREGIDIVYLLDVSTSMDAQDVAPSRLMKASRIISQSLNSLGGDRAALVIFAADGYTISPLTNDYAAIDSYLGSLSTNLISNQGTDFSAAFREAVSVLKGAPNTSKLVVLLSDGEDHESDENQSIKLANDNQIHVVSIGIGTDKGAPIPVQSMYGDEYKTDQYGRTVITKLEEKNLDKIAKQTNGMYLSNGTINEVTHQINEYKKRLDKTQISQSFTHDMKHLFQWFLGFAILLLFIELLTSDYKKFNGKKE
ncbi:VWA domain-containing protein [uncultured Weeksella sp.]|uniref:VWA domain-containing protein n=1 Tax=uncultured Weeksella sp. TaxID=1161389 RepID=UPI00259BB928|nr:VWA domain-containing protein [uncultured Weeksella sp.]